MKKKIQRYLSGEREGFSLIELIIVIAIMAILIGVIALVVLPYLSSSKVSKDHDTLNQVATAFKSAVAVKKSKADISGKQFSQLDSALQTKIDELLDGTVANAKAGLSSDAASGKDFYFTYDSTGCYVTIGSPAIADGEGGTFTTKAGAAS
ncbi:MAG: type II secretion system GspH family protein [Eubacterium sp.]|nr:type II secretion system GspH family protein [Eubacterium sp.]